MKAYFASDGKGFSSTGFLRAVPKTYRYNKKEAVAAPIKKTVRKSEKGFSDRLICGII